MPASVTTSEQEEEDYQPVLHFIVDVDQLTNHGINASDVSKLKLSSYYTIGQVMNAHSKVLKTIKGYSEQKVEKVKEAARKCQPHGFTGMMTAQELLMRRKGCFRIQTGSKQWDTILGGGFESRSVNEVYGEYRCGKTQLCHTMCVIAQTVPKLKRPMSLLPAASTILTKLDLDVSPLLPHDLQPCLADCFPDFAAISLTNAGNIATNPEEIIGGKYLERDGEHFSWKHTSIARSIDQIGLKHYWAHHVWRSVLQTYIKHSQIQTLYVKSPKCTVGWALAKDILSALGF
ncbi:uncharacterized protein MYCFIDRAFT_196089 [Pseudocercospora fijiensis CIRAD86]|uniref:Rad51-like C-terminal domain-containing protein n=1 Tax=Pseudocercospora fijiensis (strain CIRAD86) TaxID=383855 RepID=M3AZC9_PSEFD|nr:uncharacterized protein MYCFIDRAFT_196089 [Pseudocercospora fijiensis CIRAD86]EME82562.1 hypothetical protein MYCFIDRAFT_196089 [Pseudocercospora fijiensis CIRAD86]